MTLGWAQDSSKPSAPAADLSGVHDFDFLFGEWRVHHRVKRAGNGNQWLEFDGTCSAHGLMAGSANVEDHVFDKANGITRAVGLRAYDPKNASWAIWWIDGRNPHGALDPPMKGRFDKGTGTFYLDSTLDGKAVRTRFIWSLITPQSARWEQAYSYDAGKSWDTNWIMEFRRVGQPAH